MRANVWLRFNFIARRDPKRPWQKCPEAFVLDVTQTHTLAMIRPSTKSKRQEKNNNAASLHRPPRPLDMPENERSFRLFAGIEFYISVSVSSFLFLRSKCAMKFGRHASQGEHSSMEAMMRRRSASPHTNRAAS